MENRFNKLKDSVILMGIDWSKAARLKAVNDIKKESPVIADVIDDLDRFFREKN
jgi:hypothetical protein